jgi:flagellar motor switch protein FliN/FliY
MTQPALDQDASQEELNRAIEELRGALHEEEQQRPATQQPTGFQQPTDAAAGHSSSLILDIPVEVQIVLGSTEMAVSDLMGLQKGSTVALNRRVGEPVDVMVNGRRIARGEITVLENDPSRFGIRLTEVSTGTKPA